LTLKAARMLKATQLEFGPTTDPRLKDGMLFILIRQRDLRLRVSQKTSDSTSTDHST
jgi:hypothetical protein